MDDFGFYFTILILVLSITLVISGLKLRLLISLLNSPDEQLRFCRSRFAGLKKTLIFCLAVSLFLAVSAIMTEDFYRLLFLAPAVVMGYELFAWRREIKFYQSLSKPNPAPDES